MNKNVLMWPMIVLLVAGCAGPQPVLYPNAQFKQGGQPSAESAIAQCRQRADSAKLDESSGRVVKDTAGGALIGSVVGAAVGAVSGDVGRGAAIGAAGGGSRGLIGGLFRSKDPGPVYQAYVNRCLSERGYEVIGWK